MNYVGHELVLNMEHVNAEANYTLDTLGIAKNAREEKIRARQQKMDEAKLKQEAENAKMAKLYRQHVLGEKPPAEGMVSVDMIRPASNNAASPINRQRQEEEELVAGD